MLHCSAKIRLLSLSNKQNVSYSSYHMGKKHELSENPTNFMEIARKFSKLYSESFSANL